MANRAAFKLAEAVLIFVYPFAECRAKSIDGDSGGDGESNEIIPSTHANSSVSIYLFFYLILCVHLFNVFGHEVCKQTKMMKEEKKITCWSNIMKIKEFC